MVIPVDKKAKIYILAEYHPTNLRALSFLSAFAIKKEIENQKNELIKKLYQERDADMNALKLLEKYVNEMIETVNMLTCAHEIREKELEYLERFIDMLDRKTVVYLEGNREFSASQEGRFEIVKLAEEKNLKLFYLDEGNVRYEKLMDENGRVLKHAYEIQIGREDFWVNKIEETIGGAGYGIVIVGANHVSNSWKGYLRKIYKRISPKYRNIGYFDKKLRKRGYEVVVLDITCG